MVQKPLHVESGAYPIELDYELNSIARSDFGGTLDAGFTAHPKGDPVTGELVAITYDWQRPSLRYVTVDTAGRAQTRAEIPTPHKPMVHDCGAQARESGELRIVRAATSVSALISVRSAAEAQAGGSSSRKASPEAWTACFVRATLPVVSDIEENLPSLERDAAVDGSDGHYTARISPSWVVWSPQGGYLMAMVLRAGGVATTFSRPLSLSCHFLSVPKVGDVEIHVTSLRKTRSAESLRVSLAQEDRLFLEAMMWTGEAVPGFEHAATGMPDVPRYDALTAPSMPSNRAATGFHTLWANLDIRPCGPLSSARTEPAEPRQRDWIRFRNFASTDNAFVDAGRYAVCLDTFTWPAATHAHPGDSRFIAPTLSFAIDFHQWSASEWLLSDAYVPCASEGRLALQQKVWSPEGALLASASGTMICRPRPSGM